MAPESLCLTCSSTFHPFRWRIGYLMCTLAGSNQLHCKYQARAGSPILPLSLAPMFFVLGSQSRIIPSCSGERKRTFKHTLTWYIYIYVCMYVRMYACMHVCMYVRTYVRTYVPMYVCMHACTYVRMYVCNRMYVCMHACMYVRTYVRMHACMHVCTYVRMYVRM